MTIIHMGADFHIHRTTIIVDMLQVPLKDTQHKFKTVEITSDSATKITLLFSQIFSFERGLEHVYYYCNPLLVKRRFFGNLVQFRHNAWIIDLRTSSCVVKHLIFVHSNFS